MKAMIKYGFLLTSASALASQTDCPINPGVYSSDNIDFPHTEFKCAQYGSNLEVFIRGDICNFPNMAYRHLRGNLWRYYSSIITDCSPTYLHLESRNSFRIQMPNGLSAVYSRSDSKIGFENDSLEP